MNLGVVWIEETKQSEKRKCLENQGLKVVLVEIEIVGLFGDTWGVSGKAVGHDGRMC